MKNTVSRKEKYRLARVMKLNAGLSKGAPNCR
jgi:hypothetical protein